MSVPRTAGILKRYQLCQDEVKNYFEHFPKLAKEFPWDVSISYMFAQVELAHNMTIYCGIVKLHRAEGNLVWQAVNNQHITRPSFKEFFKTVFGVNMKKSISEKIEEAEKIRDKILHGKPVSEELKRKAVVDILDYAKNFNQEIYRIAGFKPFGSLRGFKGRAQPLDKSTSRWILKGMGFNF